MAFGLFELYNRYEVIYNDVAALLSPELDPNDFLKVTGFEKNILHLIFSLNHVDIMPLSLKCIASTSDAVFWCGTLAPIFPVVQPIKDVFICDKLRYFLCSHHR